MQLEVANLQTSKLVPSDVCRENQSRILIDMDSRPQLGDKFFKAQVVSEIHPGVTIRIF